MPRDVARSGVGETDRKGKAFASMSASDTGSSQQIEDLGGGRVARHRGRLDRRGRKERLNDKRERTERDGHGHDGGGNSSRSIGAPTTPVEGGPCRLIVGCDGV